MLFMLTKIHVYEYIDIVVCDHIYMDMQSNHYMSMTMYMHIYVNMDMYKETKTTDLLLAKIIEKSIWRKRSSFSNFDNFS